MSGVRRVVKAVFETALCRSGMAAAMRRVQRDDTVILAYHNIIPEGEPVTGDRSLHLRQADFGRQLDVLGRTHEIVSLEEYACDAGRGRPRAVITFDDAYAGAITAGVEELERRQLPATVFVAPSFVGGGRFWWDGLAGSAAGLGGEARAHALGALRGSDAAVREWAAARGLTLEPGPAHQACATEEALRALAGRGITLGSHSMTHANLAGLAAADLRRELVDSLAWLRARFPNVVPWLAYPYGLFSPEVEAAARAAGYAGALRVDGGRARARDRSAAAAFSTPRLNVPAGVSIEGFELRVSGLIR